MKNRYFGNRMADRLFGLIIIWAVLSLLLFGMGGTHPTFNPSDSLFHQLIFGVASFGIGLLGWPLIFLKANAIGSICLILLNFIFIYKMSVLVSKTRLGRRLRE